MPSRISHEPALDPPWIRPGSTPDPPRTRPGPDPDPTRTRPGPRRGVSFQATIIASTTDWQL